MYRLQRKWHPRKIAALLLCVVTLLATLPTIDWRQGTLGPAAATASAAWYDAYYKYCRPLTINSGPVATTTTGGFALYFSTTTAWLKATSSSGKIEKLNAARTLPVDIIFTSGTDCDSNPGTLLDYYHESYASTTGELHSWIEVMDLSSTTDKTILMYYGNTRASDQSDETGTFGALGEVAVYDLREDPSAAGASGITNSASATLHNGTATSGMLAADSVAGKVGKAINFDGTNDLISFGSNAALDLSAGTALFWFSVDSYTTDRTIWSKHDNTTGEGNIYVQARAASDATNYQRLRLWSHNINSPLYADDARTATSTWTHGGITFNSPGTLQQIYLRGVLDNSRAVKDPMTDTTANLLLGARTASPFTQYFDGKIDDFRLYNRVLSSADIATIYANTNDVNTFWSEGAEENAPTTITVSGTLYSDEGSTAITTSKTIKLAVGTSTVSVQSTTTQSGAYTFTVPLANLVASTSLVAWVDGDSGTRATAVTKLDARELNVSGLNLYQNHVILRHEGDEENDALRIEDINIYDSENDSDIQYLASTTASTKLSVHKGNELYVWPNSTFVPSGSVTVSGNAGSGTDGSFELAAGAKYRGAVGLLSVAGNFVLATSSIFMEPSSGVLFNATTTGKTIDADIQTYKKNLGDFTFNGSGGGWTVASHATTSDLTITTGSLTVSTAVQLTVTEDFSNSGTFNNSGTLLVGPNISWTPYNVSRISSTTVASYESATRDVFFKPDGTKMYVIGNSTSGEVNEFNLTTPWDVSTLAHVAALSTGTLGDDWSVVFTPDGTTMYAARTNPAPIHKYTLSTPWSISTASYAGVVYTDSLISNLDQILFRPDGRQAYFICSPADSVTTYNLAIPWEISSSSMSYVRSYSMTAQETDMQTIVLSPDGTRMFTAGRTGDDVNYYTLATPWEVSTSSVTYVGTPYTIDEPQIRGMYLNPSGTRFISLGATGVLYQYNLKQEPSIFTGTLTGSSALGNVTQQANTLVTFAASASTTNLTLAQGTTTLPRNLTVAGNYVNSASMRNAGGTVFLTGSSKTLSGSLINQNAFHVLTISGSYTASNNASTTELTITSSGSLTAPSLLTVSGNYSNNGTFTKGSGTVVVGPGNGYDFSTAVHSGSGQDVSADEASTRSIFFKPDGTKAYITGISGDEVNEYTLGTPWDVSTRGSATIKSIASQTTSPWKVRFIPDGSRMYITTDNSGSINSYYLTTPWSVSTASHRAPTLSFSAQTSAIEDLEFSGDGLQAYILSETNQTIYTYTLTKPWDLRTATYANVSYTVTAQETSSESFKFNQDGTKLYLIGNAGDDVNVYTLSTPWTIATSSVTFVNAPLSVAAQDGIPRDMYTSPDGTRMFMLGNNSTIYTYALKESSQSLAGNLVGSSALNHLMVRNAATTTFSNNASTSNVTISSGTTSAPSLLSISGNYTNNSYFKANGGLVSFNGTSQQTATGTMTGSSAFSDVTIANTSGSGAGSQSVIFGRSATLSDLFTMLASTSAQFLAGSTLTSQNIDWGGTVLAPVWLRSSSNGTAWLLDVDGTKTVRRVNVRDSNATASTGGITAVNSTDATGNTNWTFNSQSVGVLTLSDHDAAQVGNAFTANDATNATLFRFKLVPTNESATTTQTVITLSGVKKLSASQFSNIRLYRDYDGDGAYDASDGQIGGSGSMSLSGQSGTITFNDDWLATTSRNYIVVADWTAPSNGSFMVASLPTTGIVPGSGLLSYETVSVAGSVSSIQHHRNNRSGSGAGSGAVGGDAPAGAGQQSGGGAGGGSSVDTNSGGQTIGNEVGFLTPSAQSGSWTNGANAYDSTDGTYATAATAVTHTYSNLGFTVPSSNTITGIEVKVEVSGTTGAGTMDLELSWDGGTSWTSADTTPTLTTTDTVRVLGGPSDLWGHGWSSSEFSNGNFRVRVTAAPSSNTVQLDAIQVRVYHNATGGGGGGGGEI